MYADGRTFDSDIIASIEATSGTPRRRFDFVYLVCFVVLPYSVQHPALSYKLRRLPRLARLPHLSRLPTFSLSHFSRFPSSTSSKSRVLDLCLGAASLCAIRITEMDTPVFPLSAFRFPTFPSSQSSPSPASP